MFLNEEIKFWFPTIFSTISLYFSIIGIKGTSLFQNWQMSFEETREKVNRQEKIIDYILKKLNIRASLIPYFNIILDDSKIEEENGKIYLEISLINIGKESATNIGVCQMEDRKEIITVGDSKNNYTIYKYIDKYYAMVGDRITFSVMTDRKEKLMNDFLRFKIEYYDLIGNRYEQEFKFGYYDDFNGKDEKYYNLNNTSYLPKLVEENKYE